MVMVDGDGEEVDEGEVTWNMLFRPILAPCGLNPFFILLITLSILTLLIIIISIISIIIKTTAASNSLIILSINIITITQEQEWAESDHIDRVEV